MKIAKEALKVLALLMLTIVVAGLGVCLLIPYTITAWILDRLSDVGIWIRNELEL